MNYNYHRKSKINQINQKYNNLLINNNNEYNKMVGNYLIGKRIGKGTFGKVKIGTHIPTNEKVAIKILEKSKIVDSSDLERVRREMKIFKKVYHPYVTQLYEIIDTPHHIYLVMEYADSGELFDYIVNHGRINERDACRFFHQIVEAVDYVHHLKVCHRDLKPENILLQKNKDFYTVKLIDFGLSNTYEGDVLLKTACGSPCYAAPEMIAGKKYVGSLADIWSLGVVLFAMVCGYLPFEDDNTAVLYRKILSGNYKLPNYLSREIRDLFSHILETDPSKRYTMNDIRKHRWYTQVISYVPPYPEDCMHKENIEETIIEWLGEIDIDKSKAIESLQNNLHNSYTAAYYLLKKKIAREGLPPNKKLGVVKSTPTVSVKGKENLEGNSSDKKQNKENSEISNNNDDEQKNKPIVNNEKRKSEIKNNDNKKENNDVLSKTAPITGLGNEIEKINNTIVPQPLEVQDMLKDDKLFQKSPKEDEKVQNNTKESVKEPAKDLTSYYRPISEVNKNLPVVPRNKKENINLNMNKRPVSSMGYSPRLTPVIPTNPLFMPRPPPNPRKNYKNINIPQNIPNSSRERVPSYNDHNLNVAPSSSRTPKTSPRSISPSINFKLTGGPHSTRIPSDGKGKPGIRRGRKLIQSNDVTISYKKPLIDVMSRCKEILNELRVNIQSETTDKFLCDTMGITYEIQLKSDSLSTNTSLTFKKSNGDDWIFKHVYF